jgi:hypothetical protein
LAAGQVVLDRHHDGLGAAWHAQLAQDTADVKLHRGATDGQLLRDLWIGESAHH